MAGSMIIDNNIKVNLPVGRLVFHDLFTPKAFTDKKTGQSGNPKYGLTLVFDDGADFSEYKKGIEKLKKLPEIIRMGEEWFQGLRKPIRKEHDPEKIEKYPFLKDKLFVTMQSFYPLVLFSPSVQRYSSREEAEGAIYRGCYGVVQVTPGIHNKDKISLRPVAFQKAKDGEPIVSGPAPSIDSFVPYTTPEDSLAGMDEI